VQSLSRDTNGSEREIPAERLEVAVLDRTRPQARKFKRIVGGELSRLLESGNAGASAESDEDEGESDDGK
jgi:proteasome alpha subunit